MCSVQGITQHQTNPIQTRAQKPTTIIHPPRTERASQPTKGGRRKKDKRFSVSSHANWSSCNDAKQADPASYHTHQQCGQIISAILLIGIGCIGISSHHRMHTKGGSRSWKSDHIRLQCDLRTGSNQKN